MINGVKKKIIIISVIVIVAGWGGYQFFKKPKQALYDFVVAEKGSIIQEVSVTGTVTPAKKIDLQFQTQGEIKEIKIKVGNQVKAGDELVKLDISELNSQLLDKQASLELAKAKLDQLLAGASQEDIKLAQTAVLNAQDNLNKTKESATKDVASSEASVASAQVTLDNNNQNLIDVKNDAEQSLDNEYKSAFNELNDAYLKADEAMAYLDDVFADYPDGYLLDTCFSYNNNQTKAEAEMQKSKANNALVKIDATNDKLSLDSSRTNIDAALVEFKTELESISLSLKLTSDILDKSISLCSDKVISTIKTNINTSRTNLNTSLASIRSAEQDVSTIKNTNQTNINAAQAKVDSSQASLESAKQSLAATQAKTDSQLSVAEGQVKTAQDQLALKKAPARQTDIALYQAQIKQAQANVSYLVEQISKNTLLSPIDGIITYIEGEIGEIAKVGQNVISLISLNNFQIEADISEADIAKVAIDNPAEITLDAFGENKWSGKVISIDPAEKLISGVVYYKTTFDFDNFDKRVSSGMTANLIITTATKENVLVVPQRAVIEKNSHKIVRVLINGEMKEQTVETGLRGSLGEIEITSGLKEGDKVITFIK